MTDLSSNKERNFLIDFTKAFAMILVVVQHSWSMLNLDTADHGILCYGYRAIVNCGVPLFVLISGALILNKPIISLGEFYHKRLPRIIMPWIVWAGVVYVISLFSGAYDWYDGTVLSALINFIPCLLENRVNEFHWFVHMILALYLLAPFLQRALQRLTSNEVLFVLVIWAMGVLLQQYFSELFLTQYLSSLWKYLGVFVAGYYLRTARMPKHTSYLGILLVVVFYLLDILTDCKISLVEPLIAIALGLWLMNAKRLENTPNWLRTPFINISRYSYTIYLVHIVLIRVLYTMLDKVWTIPSSLLPIMPLLTAVVVLTIVYVACLCYDKIRFLPNSVVGIG